MSEDLAAIVEAAGIPGQIGLSAQDCEALTGIKASTFLGWAWKDERRATRSADERAEVIQVR